MVCSRTLVGFIDFFSRNMGNAHKCDSPPEVIARVRGHPSPPSFLILNFYNALPLSPQHSKARVYENFSPCLIDLHRHCLKNTDSDAYLL